jgi:hypothetical protein
MKYVFISIISFVCFAMILVFGPMQEVEIAHCVLSGLLGVVIVLVSIVISKINKVLNSISSSDNDKE